MHRLPADKKLGSCFEVGRLHTDFQSIHPEIEGCKVASGAGRQKFSDPSYLGRISEFDSSVCDRSLNLREVWLANRFGLFWNDLEHCFEADYVIT